MSPANKFSHAHIIDYTAVHQDSMYTNTSTVQYGTPLEKKSLILIRGITLSRWYLLAAVWGPRTTSVSAADGSSQSRKSKCGETRERALQS